MPAGTVIKRKQRENNESMQFESRSASSVPDELDPHMGMGMGMGMEEHTSEGYVDNDVPQEHDGGVVEV